jgi:phosphoglycolate phosphatase-like HAD superfamily hydrolase
MKPLVLFDIDGTLMRSQGVGVSAMQMAFDAIYAGKGLRMEGIPVAGRLDTLIWADVMRRGGLEPDERELPRFRASYKSFLAERLHAASVRRMPGVLELVERLHAAQTSVLGLLTGNWPDTAHLKISTAGFTPGHFRIGAFAGDGPDRRSLPPVAIERCARETGYTPRPERTIIIGDTPLDVDCAHHNGCRVIAVATGDFTVDALRETGADLVVETLADIDAIDAWLHA